MTRTVVVLIGIAALLLIGIAVGTRLTRRKLERWARGEGLRLVEFRGAPFWRGPRAWRRTDEQEDYRIVVEDPNGRRRTGWVLITGPWHPFGRDTIEVRWD